MFIMYFFLYSGITDRVQTLEDNVQKLQELSDAVRDMDAALKKFEDKVSAHKSLGPEAKASKHLEKMRVSFLTFLD